MPYARILERNVYVGQKGARAIVSVFGVHMWHVRIGSGGHWRDNDPQTFIALRDR